MPSADSNLCGYRWKKWHSEPCLGINNNFKRGAHVADTLFFAIFAVLFRSGKTDYTLIHINIIIKLWHF